MKGGFYLTDGFTKMLETSKIYSKNDPFYVEQIKAYLFLNSPEFTLLSNKSLYGYVFLQKFNKAADLIAPAQEVDLNNIRCTEKLNKECFKEIVNYVYKVCFIGPSGTSFKLNTGADFGFVTEDELQNEAHIQYTLYNNQFMNGSNIVPPILSPKPMIIKSEDDILFKACFKNPEFKSAFTKARLNGLTGIGAICMGFTEGYDTLYNLIHAIPVEYLEKSDERENLLKLYITLARLAYLMVLYHGYIHGDAHSNNVMINPRYKDWVSPEYPGRALVIDFGKARRVNPSEQAKIQQEFDAESAFKAGLGIRRGSAKKLLKLIVNGNSDDKNSQWLINPQFAGDDINPPFFTLLENYKRHEVLIKSKYPSYALSMKVDDVMTMLKPVENVKMLGGKKTKRRLNKKRKTRR